MIIFIPLGFLSFVMWLVGHHGAILFFRPHMVEDWFIWGFMLLGVIAIGLAFTFRKKKYDIDFSDEKLIKLTSACESLVELFEKNEIWNYIYLIKDINECALNYDFDGFRKSTTHHSLVGTAYSINDGVLDDIEVKTQFKAVLEIICEMGHNHPNILRTIKLL